MSQLTDGYSQIVTGIEGWMSVIKEKMDASFDPGLAVLFSNLSVLLYAHQTAIPQVEELERILLALGLKPHEPSVSTDSLDALWGNEDPPVEGSSPQ